MAGIEIGNKFDESSFDGLADAVVRVLQQAAESRTDEATTRTALSILARAAGVSGLTIEGCTFTGLDTGVSMVETQRGFGEGTK